MKWCVEDAMSEYAVVVEADGHEAAAREGRQRLVGMYPDAMTCEHCESVTLRDVRVYALGQEWKFEAQVSLVEVAGD